MRTPENPRRDVRIWAALFPLIIAACSTMPRDFETPKFSIADIAPKDMTLMEQRFDVKVRIQNPNNFDLGINGVRFDIALNGKEFGTGMSGAKVTVPRFGSEVISGEVITGLGSILRQVQGFTSGITKVQFSLKGKAFAESPASFTIPFEDIGDVDLNFGSSTEKQQDAFEKEVLR
jgi:LEA14-like dessication related protein